MKTRSLFLAGLTAILPLAANAGQTTTTITKSEDTKSALETWWSGKYATGNWFGVRDTLEDHGLTLGAEWKANILFNVDGGLTQRGGYDDEFKFRGTLDFFKLTGWKRSRDSPPFRTCATAVARA